MNGNGRPALPGSTISRVAHGGTAGDLDHYRLLLNGFARYSAGGWRKGTDGHVYFGDGGSGENGIRTQGNVAFCCALLASDPAFASPQFAVNQGEMLERFIAVAVYMATTHRTGDDECAHGGKWGLEWQSAWWTTRMAAGALLLWPRLPDHARVAIERVVTAEADAHLSRVCPTGLAMDTKAEENAWDAEVLAAAYALFPGHQNAPLWLRKASEFWLNTFSAPGDRTSLELCGGKPLRDQVYTVNVHADYTLENHGAYHFCYVASPLQSIAWARFCLVKAGVHPPEAHLHHVADIWERAKPLFLENRFAYPSGKDWARYTYGQYFIVPALVLLQSSLADRDARAIELKRLALLDWEQSVNNDGSWFGARVTHGLYHGQECKYETDCYACIGLAYLLHLQSPAPIEPTDDAGLLNSLCQTHISPESGICHARSTQLFASFSWTTLTEQKPNLQFMPAGCDSLVEWAPSNFLGSLKLIGTADPVGVRTMRQVGEAGFEITGKLEYRQRHRAVYRQFLSAEINTVLGSAVINTEFVAANRVYVIEADALNCWFANDIFNGMRRTIICADGRHEVLFQPHVWSPTMEVPSLKRKFEKLAGRDNEPLELSGRWLNIDDCLGVIQLGEVQPFYLRKYRKRNDISNGLHCDRLSLGRPYRLRKFNSGEAITGARFLLIAATSEETSRLGERLSAQNPPLAQIESMIADMIALRSRSDGSYVPG